MRQHPAASGGSGFGKSKRETRGFPDPKVMPGRAQNNIAARDEAYASGLVPRAYIPRRDSPPRDITDFSDPAAPYVREYQDYARMFSDALRAAIEHARGVDSVRRSEQYNKPKPGNPKKARQQGAVNKLQAWGGN